MRMKRTIAMVMALTIIGGAVCTNNGIAGNSAFTAYAEEAKAEATVKDGVKYDVYEDFAVVTGYEKELSGDLVIPAKLGEVPVKAIATIAFEGCEGIVSVTIPESVIYIGSGAFANCAELTSVELLGSFNDGSDKAKKYEKEYGSDIGYFEEGAFIYCPKLEKVGYSTENNRSMSSNMFGVGNSSLSEDDYDHDKYVYVGEHRDHTGVEYLLLPKTFKTVEITGGKSIDAFELADISTLETVILPDSLEEIGWSAFIGCTSLKNIELPNSLKTIGYQVFCLCNSIEELVLPDKLETIGNGAFCNMDGLKSAVIPASVKTIGYGILCGCEKLTSVKIEGEPEIKDVMYSPDAKGNDNGFGIAALCPNVEYVESPNKIFYFTDAEGIRKEKIAREAFFGLGEHNNDYDGDDKDKYDRDKDEYSGMDINNGIYIPKTLKTELLVLPHVPNGDVNLDGTTDISDAVLIMQSICNPDKYKLGRIASTLGDVTGNFDGVTNKDALTIQRYLLKLVDRLPDWIRANDGT